MFAGGLANPLGKIYFVNSNTGSNGNPGTSRIHPFLTLTRAVAVAAAGDTIICEPGGSETITASIALTAARLKIVCPVEPLSDQGFQILSTGAVVDQMTVAGADCHIEGLKFSRSAGAGAANAGINAAATADRIAVVNCLFDGSLLTSAWTNFGIELTDDLQHYKIRGCQFRDMHRSIIQVIATGVVQVGGLIQDCDLWVGRATAYGYYNDPTSTGVSGGVTISRCKFKEIIGSTGAAATDVWDGVAATDGGSGPMNIGALCDRVTVEDCVAYSASGETFENLCKVDAGGLVEFAGNSTSAGTSGGATAAALSTHDGVLVAGLAAAVTARLQDVRTIKASDVALDGGTVVDVFTVSGDAVEVVGLLLHLTEAVSADACNASWESDPTVGAGQAPMCAVVDIVSAAIGDHFYIPGLASAAMVKAANGTIVGNRCKEPQIVFPGGIDLVLANSAPSSGIADAYLIYRPLTDTSAVA